MHLYNKCIRKYRGSWFSKVVKLILNQFIFEISKIIIRYNQSQPSVPVQLSGDVFVFLCC